jgi:ATP-binding cassette subfamily B protein
LLADADVVVLDEPSANLDSHNETRLKDAISTLADGRTIVVVAHRRSTVAGSDVVIALDDDDGFLVARRGDPGFSDVLTRLEVGK